MTQTTLQTSAEKLAALRTAMKKAGVDGYIIPRADEFQGEYVPARAERLKWLTGFSGSAGTAAVLDGKAMVISDGRYTIQLSQQVDKADYERLNSSAGDTMAAWLAGNAPAGGKVGYDPRVMTMAAVDNLRRQLRAQNVALVPLEDNLVDAIWAGQPDAPADPVEIFPESIAGHSAADKRQMIAKNVADEGAVATVITMPDSIAWLLNIRGRDVPHTPLALSYAVVHENGDVDWFIPRAKIPAAVQAHLGNHVQVRDPAELPQAMADLAAAAKKAGKPVWVDPNKSGDWFRQALEDKGGAELLKKADPCVWPKAIKTQAEQKAIIDAHRRDGAAMARFLKWVDDNAPGGNLTELDVEAQLLQFREMDKDLTDTSFDTIAGWAGNGAIVHYRADKKSNATITPPGLLLVDSGGQYSSGGTTDITRTMAVGEPTEDMKRHYTLVLKGHIAVSRARFPEGTNGPAIDALARRHLWEAGLDFDHGTGHGVGCFLSVHEEAASISHRAGMPFAPGMLISNEPGYYKENAYGIRIENLILVREDGMREGSKQKMLAFDTVTLAPYDRRLILTDMLGPEEINWLDGYHARVLREIGPLVEPDVEAWLRTACEPLKKNLTPAWRPPQGPRP